MRIHQLLESKNQQDVGEIFSKFFPIAMKVIGLKHLPKIHLEARIKDTHQPTFGQFVNDSAEIHLAIKNRHPLDVLRTLAHELVHYKQKLDDRLTPNSGKTGSPEENQAHELAGIVMRTFNKKYPEYFLQPAITLEENMNINEIKIKLSGDTFPLDMDMDSSTPGKSEYYDFSTDHGNYKISVNIFSRNSEKLGKIKQLKVFFMAKMIGPKDDREHLYTGETKVKEPLDVLVKIARTIIEITKEKIFDDSDIQVIDFRLPSPDFEAQKLEKVISKILSTNMKTLFPGWKLDKNDNYLYREKDIISKVRQFKDKYKSSKLNEYEKKLTKLYESFKTIDEARFDWETPFKEKFPEFKDSTILSRITTRLSGFSSNMRVAGYDPSFNSQAVLSSFLNDPNAKDMVDQVINQGKTITWSIKSKDAPFSDQNPIRFSIKDPAKHNNWKKPLSNIMHKLTPNQKTKLNAYLKQQINITRKSPEEVTTSVINKIQADPDFLNLIFGTSIEKIKADNSYPWVSNLQYCFPTKNVEKLAKNLENSFVKLKKTTPSLTADDFIISFFVSSNPESIIDKINAGNLVVRYTPASGEFWAGSPRGYQPKK